MTKKHPSSFGRREILKGAGAGLLAGTSLMQGGTASAAAMEEAAWDYEADVVCVGSGAAAMSAAIAARDGGAEVLVVEKMPITGGTTRRSGGIVWIPNNKFLRQQGVTDEKDACLRYMARYGFPRDYDPDAPHLGLTETAYKKLEALYDNGSVMLEHFERIDALKFQEFTMWGLDVLSPDYADILPENAVKRGRAIETAAGAGSGTGISLGGGSMVAQMEAWLKANGVPILLGHKVERLITQGDRVIGIEARKGKDPVRIKARRGVVFGTGGFAHNPQLLANQRFPVYGACAAASSSGDFIQIAGRAGARMGALDTAWRTQVMLEDALRSRFIPWCVFVLPGDSMIMVNRYGRRVANEAQNYNDRTFAHFHYDPVKHEYPNKFLFWIFDRRVMERFAGAYPVPKDIRETPNLISGATLAEFAANLSARLAEIEEKHGDSMQLDKDFVQSLRHTIQTFNQYARTGTDPEFGRGTSEFDRIWNKAYSAMRENPVDVENPYPNSCMHPMDEKGPYYGFILAPGALDTCAGPDVNEKAQVLRFDGTPIPGLYAAGNCAASPAGDAYFGAGGTLGIALTNGYIAGLTVMRDKI